MKTASVMIQNLCVPCCCRCRYCLLSWSGQRAGVDWERGLRLAERYIGELSGERPEISAGFSFGYSMEHPALRTAIRDLARLGSPTASFMQCGGMKMRDEAECLKLMEALKEEEIRQLNFTLYGLKEYHDRFAGRAGDFALLMRMMEAARQTGIPFTAGIPLTMENVCQAQELASVLQRTGVEKIFFFIPHEEGRGRLLSGIRLGFEQYAALPSEVGALLNREKYRTEEEWLEDGQALRETRRMILLSLRKDNIERYESMSALSALAETEALDEAYYAAFPSFSSLAELYGNPRGRLMYSFRDLYASYRARFLEDHPMCLTDVTDERFSGSRRY